MKVTINEWDVRLDNEAIKAIRFCLGYNTDLRVSLGKDRNGIVWTFLHENCYRIFGIDFASKRPNVTSPDWYKYDRCLMNVAKQILR